MTEPPFNWMGVPNHHYKKWGWFASHQVVKGVATRRMHARGGQRASPTRSPHHACTPQHHTPLPSMQLGCRWFFYSIHICGNHLGHCWSIDMQRLGWCIYDATSRLVKGVTEPPWSHVVRIVWPPPNQSRDCWTTPSPIYKR